MKSGWLAPLTAASLLLTVSSFLILIVHGYVPLPYMDEEFHVRQARKYCDGNFVEWDPKITTPPGLYVLSVGILGPLSSVISEIKCDVLALRSINILFAVGNLYLFYAISQKLNSPKEFSSWQCSLTALNLATFPTLYFFTFLYYTDPGSVFIIFLTYLFSLHGNHWAAATLGATSLLFRQTNIVWLAFYAALAVKKIVEMNATKELKRVDRSSFKYVMTLLRVGMSVLSNRRKDSLTTLKNIAYECGPYLIVALGFSVFVWMNGGVVLGDRTAHQVTVHVPQLFYFVVFVLTFASPIISSMAFMVSTRKYLFRRRMLLTIALIFIIVTIAVAFNTRAHPYLLADNRHYTFYVWRKFFGRHNALKFLPIPVYILCGMCVLRELMERHDIVWCLLYTICVAANLITQELLEFRYFIVPYLMFRLQLRTRSSFTTTRLCIELFMNTLINFITLYVFLEKPFVWPDRDVLQRFMW